VNPCQRRLLPLLVSALALIGCALRACHAGAAESDPQIRLDADYPGGNILVERMDGDKIHIRQDLRDTSTWWFWWNFRVRGAAGRTLTFQFAGENPIGVLGPALSRDDGGSWSWLGAESAQGALFRYAFAPQESSVRFAFAVPYQQSDFDAFVAAHQERVTRGQLQISRLCQSRKGRPVPLIHVAEPQGEPSFRVLVTARHHACESMASFVLEGLLRAFLVDTESADWLRRHVELIAVPFVDCDGVADGDQGKNRTPRDHNRDYAGTSIYPETAAIRAMASAWVDGKLTVALDLHCPWIRGPHNDVIYMVGSSLESVASEQKMFAEILERVRTGPLVYRAADNLPFGQAWNTATNFSQGMSFARWAGELEAVKLSTTFEIPYAAAGGTPVTPENARAFGQDLAAALRVYLLRSRKPGQVHLIRQTGPCEMRAICATVFCDTSSSGVRRSRRRW